jgi:hypothetical protein
LKGDEQARGFAQAAFGAVAGHSPADAAGGREANADCRHTVGPVAGLGQDRAGRAGLASGRGQEVRSFLQAFDGGFAAEGRAQGL